MTYATVEDSLLEMVRDRIVTPGGVATAWPNAKFDGPPRDENDLELPWQRVSIQWLDRDDINAIGRTSLSGRLVISVFVPLRVGTRKLLEVAQAAVDAIEQGDAGKAQFFPRPRLQDVTTGTNRKAGWLQANVTAPFFADEV